MEASTLREWIGRSEAHRDTVTAGLIERYLATVGERMAGLEPPPTLGAHWCLAPPAVHESATGPDGHPARGQFLPPVPLPRRMWAGGGIVFHDLLRAGDEVERRSRIADVQLKHGRSGALCFVAVDHAYATVRGTAVEERHDIVYREAASGRQAPFGDKADADRPGDVTAEIMASPLLLFRYSAITFNGHRIHYDRTYAMEREHYDGLVVHGPLQATFALRLAAALDGKRLLHRFTYRGVSPLTDGSPLLVRARRLDDHSAEVIVMAADRRITMTGHAEWRS